MNCKDVSELSSLYLSRELDAARSMEVRRHLETCSSCAAEMDQLAEVDTRVREAVVLEHVDSSAIESRVRQSIRPSRRMWIGVAAAIVIGIGAFQISRSADRTCAAAALDHRREVVNGENRVWLTDITAIAELAGGRGIFIPQIAPDGYRLERGKLCRLNGRVFLHLVYRDGVGEASMFVNPGDGSASAIREVQSGSEHAAAFRAARGEVIVVTDRSSESAVRMARAAERAL